MLGSEFKNKYHVFTKEKKAFKKTKYAHSAQFCGSEIRFRVCTFFLFYQ